MAVNLLNPDFNCPVVCWFAECVLKCVLYAFKHFVYAFNYTLYVLIHGLYFHSFRVLCACMCFVLVLPFMCLCVVWVVCVVLCFRQLVATQGAVAGICLFIRTHALVF